MRPEPPAPGTWRRDDGATSFLPGAVQGTPGGSAPNNSVAAGSGASAQPTPPLKPAGPEMAPCPYCDKFEYEVVEGVVTQAILDHLEAAHPAIWNRMKEEEAMAAEKVEEEFT